MKIYTRTGDQGETGLFGVARVSKNDPRVEAYGEVDELNSAIGWVRAQGVDTPTDELLDAIQHDLFEIGAVLATAPGKKGSVDPLEQARVTALEEAIDRAEAALPRLQNFILPGGAAAGAAMHLARAVSRRAERRVVAVGAPEEVLKYLNRLSDLLFVLARKVNHSVGAPEVPWRVRSK